MIPLRTRLGFLESLVNRLQLKLTLLEPLQSHLKRKSARIDALEAELKELRSTPTSQILPAESTSSDQMISTLGNVGSPSVDVGLEEVEQLNCHIACDNETVPSSIDNTLITMDKKLLVRKKARNREKRKQDTRQECNPSPALPVDAPVNPSRREPTRQRSSRETLKSPIRSGKLIANKTASRTGQWMMFPLDKPRNATKQRKPKRRMKQNFSSPGRYVKVNRKRANEQNNADTNHTTLRPAVNENQPAQPVITNGHTVKPPTGATAAFKWIYAAGFSNTTAASSVKDIVGIYSHVYF